MTPHSFSVLILVGAAAVALAQAPSASGSGGKAGAPMGEPKKSAEAPPLTLATTAFADGASIPAKYTRAGEGKSPPLAWTNPPPGTRSYILHVHDLDTPQELYRSHPTRLHWLVWNIPATATGLPEAVSGSPGPEGSVQTSAGGPGYFGPGADQNSLDSANQPKAGFRSTRPPPVLHRYRFEIWALDTKLDVEPGTDAVKTREDVLVAMNGHVLGQASYIGLFESPPP